MTPQPRHIEAAEKIINDYLVSDEVTALVVIPTIARALAEAENRAAWDGWDLGLRGVANFFNEAEKEHDDAFVAKYGPRHTKENQP